MKKTIITFIAIFSVIGFTTDKVYKDISKAREKDTSIYYKAQKDEERVLASLKETLGRHDFAMQSIISDFK